MGSFDASIIACFVFRISDIAPGNQIKKKVLYLFERSNNNGINYKLSTNYHRLESIEQSNVFHPGIFPLLKWCHE